MNEPDRPDSESDSNQVRRIRDSLADLPPQWELNRTNRSDRELLSRHVSALRYRLDTLVRVEDQFGHEQKSVHRQRAERNALIFVLQKLALEEAGQEAAPAQTAPQQMHDRNYVKARLVQAHEASSAGYTATLPNKPGLLFHEKVSDSLPLEVSLPVWFYFAGVNGLGTAGEAETESEEDERTH